MKRSYYNIEYAQEGLHAIFNTMTMSCVLLNSEEYKLYCMETDSELSDHLFRLGIYVDDDLDEKKHGLMLFKESIERDKKSLRSYTIYTTTSCNAKCPYCFENQFAKENMSMETALAIANRIVKNQGTAKKLYIIWFGGEPLLNTKIIDIISEEVRKKIEDGIDFRASIYTNGFLFDKDLISHAISLWNLKAVQITLDGLKQTYETTKQFKAKDAFDKVIANTHLLLKSGLRVQMRLNYDYRTFEEILDLIDFLKTEFNEYNNLYVYTHRIFLNQYSDNSECATADFDAQMNSKLMKCGFRKSSFDVIKRKTGPCLAGGEYSEMFLPNGNIIKCNRDVRSVISTVTGEAHSEELNKWDNNRLNPACFNCKLLPLCGGGCIFEFLQGKKGCMISENLIYSILKEHIENNTNSLL